MPTFASSETRVVTIRATPERVAAALTLPEHIEAELGDALESSAKLDDHTVRWTRKPVEEKGVRFRAEYTVRYEYDGKDKVTWATIGEGNMRSRGEARLAASDDGTTRVEYSESIECDMECNRFLAPVLRPIVEHKIRSGVGDYLAKIKAGLERAA